MPKSQAEESTQLTEFRVKLRTDVQAKLAAYGVYLNPNHPSSATDLLTEGFNLLIADDKQFAEFWKQRHTEFGSGNNWFSFDELIDNGTLPAAVAVELAAVTRARKNILVSGGTSSGKTTLLNAFIQRIPAREMVIVIEKGSELQLAGNNVLRWEATDAKPGLPEVTVGHLLSEALHQGPDWIIVGEVCGSTAYDLLQVLNTGHSGTFSTVHADNAVGALERISGLALSAHANLNHSFVRSETANAINYVVHAGRDGSLRRCVTEVIEVKDYSHAENMFVTKQVYKKEMK